MSKKLNSTQIKNELKGNSSFFQKQEETSKVRHIFSAIPEEKVIDTVIPPHLDTKLAFNHDTIQSIRKAVKEIGKEAATHRFTTTEKRTLMEIVFRYKQQGISTSENEITRIAINYLMKDFKDNNDDSFLANMIREIYA